MNPSQILVFVMIQTPSVVILMPPQIPAPWGMLAAQGARVVVTDINEDGAAVVAAQIGDNAMHIAHNVTDEQAWVEVLGNTAAEFGGLVDVGIAVGLLAAWRLRLLAWVQLTVVVGYTLGLSVLDPSLWLDPFGALLKNLPI